VDVGKNTPKKSPAGEVRRGRVAAQNQPAGNLQKRCCTNWLSADDFAAMASRLVDMFRTNFVKFEPFVDDTVLGAQPNFLRAA
jgi:hypothetical protein